MFAAKAFGQYCKGAEHWKFLHLVRWLVDLLIMLVQYQIHGSFSDTDHSDIANNLDFSCTMSSSYMNSHTHLNPFDPRTFTRCSETSIHFLGSLVSGQCRLHSSGVMLCLCVSLSVLLASNSDVCSGGCSCDLWPHHVVLECHA